MIPAAALKYLAVFDAGLAILFSIVVISKKRDPAVTLAWVLGFFFLPVLGVLLYLFFGYQRFRLRRRQTPNPSGRLPSLHAPDAQAALPDPLRGVADLANRLTEYPVTAQNRVEVFTRADDTDTALTAAIRGARRHIHMCYYIFEPDSDGIFYRDLLAEKAREGVQVRLLMDAVGSFSVDDDFLAPLRRAGARVDFFGPFGTIRRPWAFNFRNHRKLTVIDGRVGFLGSQNIGHHFWRVGSRRIAWRETDVRVEGPAVEELQTVFAEDWHFVTRENLTGDDFFPPPSPDAAGTTLVQALPTGPDRKEDALAFIFVEALHTARERVTITTPYFIPTPAVVLALEGAARRGVRVDLLVPRRTDHPVVTWAGRSYFDEFVESGVRIFEYAEAFLHSKVVTVDGRLALLGSANMDTRSFRINFELSLLVYDEKVVGQLVDTFDKTAGQSVAVSARPARAPVRHFAEGLCRVLSPLL